MYMCTCAHVGLNLGCVFSREHASCLACVRMAQLPDPSRLPTHHLLAPPQLPTRAPSHPQPHPGATPSAPLRSWPSARWSTRRLRCCGTVWWRRRTATRRGCWGVSRCVCFVCVTCVSACACVRRVSVANCLVMLQTEFRLRFTYGARGHTLLSVPALVLLLTVLVNTHTHTPSAGAGFCFESSDACLRTHAACARTRTHHTHRTHTAHTHTHTHARTHAHTHTYTHAHPQVKDVVTGELHDLPVSGLFFAIGHQPATAFLNGQVRRQAGRQAGRQGIGAEGLGQGACTVASRLGGLQELALACPR